MAGPRQVGKTTLAKNLLQADWKNGQYFNWDLDEDRRALLAKHWIARFIEFFLASFHVDSSQKVTSLKMQSQELGTEY